MASASDVTLSIHIKADTRSASASIQNLKSKLDQLNNTSLGSGSINNVQLLQTALNGATRILQTYMGGVEKTNKSEQNLQKVTNDATKEVEEQTKATQEQIAAANKQAQSANKLVTNIQKQNTALIQQKTQYDTLVNKIALYKQSYKGLARDKDLSQQFEQLSKNCQEGSISLQSARGQFQRLQIAAKEAGVETQSFGQILKTTLSSRIRNSVITLAFGAATNAMRSLKNNIVDVDDALTQLRIVTGATDNELANYFDEAAEAAQNCASTIVDVMNSTETYSRLGYSLSESLDLATVTNEFKNVAAISSDEATTAITSILKGYNLEAEDAERVGDELTLIGQSYAISASELGEALENGGATLAVANTSLEESIALMAAGNAAMQDASKVGNALKTTSMRIRGAKTELEEEGEDTSDVKTTSKLQAEVKALTNGNVSLLDEEGAYRSIYDILLDISKVWDDMSDLNQAALLEDLAGKRNASAVASVIQNIDDLEGAYADAQDAEGTLAEASDKYIDSISGRTAQLSSAWQTFSHDLINSDLIKGIVSIGTDLVNALDKAANASSGTKIAVGGIAAAVGLVVTKGKSVLGFANNLASVRDAMGAVGDATQLTIGQLMYFDEMQAKMTKSERAIMSNGLLSSNKVNQGNAALIQGSRGISGATAEVPLAQWSQGDDAIQQQLAECVATYEAETMAIDANILAQSLSAQQTDKNSITTEQLTQKLLENNTATIQLTAAQIQEMTEQGKLTDLEAIQLAQETGLISNCETLTVEEAKKLGIDESLVEASGLITAQNTKELATDEALQEAEATQVVQNEVLSSQEVKEAASTEVQGEANSMTMQTVIVLTNVLLDEWVAMGKLNEKEADAIRQTLKLGEANTKASVSFKGLGTMIKSTLTMIGKSIQQTWQKVVAAIGSTEAIVAAIAAAIAVVAFVATECAGGIHQGTENILDDLDDLSEKIDDEESEVEELKEQLDSVNESIDELMGKGELSLTDKNDLAALQTENDLLEEQIKLKEQDLEADNIDTQKTADALYKSMGESSIFANTTVYDNSTAGGTSGFWKRFGKTIQQDLFGMGVGSYGRTAEEYMNDTYAQLVGEGTSAKTLTDAFQILDTYSDKSLSNLCTNLMEIADNLATVAEGGGEYADEAQEELGRISEIYDRINQYMGFSISNVADEWHTALSSMESDSEDLSADSLLQSFEDSLDDADFAGKFTDWVDSLSDEDKEVVALLTLDDESATWSLEEWIKEFNNTQIHLVPVVDDENSNTDYEKAENMIQNDNTLRSQVNRLVTTNNGDTTAMATELADTSKYQAIQKMLDECEMSAIQFTTSLYQGTIESKEKLDELVGSLENIADAIDSIPTLTDVWTDFSDVESGIEGLSDALAEFQDEGMITLSTISSLADTFGEVEGWENFLSVALDTSSSLDDVQKALDQLMTTYLDTSGILKDINEDTVDNVAYLLEQAGVANADEVAYTALAVQMAQTAVAEGTFDNATIEAINSMLTEKDVSYDLEGAIGDLARAYEEYQKAMTRINASEAATRLRNLGYELDAYSTAMAAYQGKNGTVLDNWAKADNQEYQDLLKYYNSLNSAQASLNSAISNLSSGSSVSVSPTNQKSSSSSSSSSSSTSSTTYDWIEVKLDKLSQKTDDLIAKNDRLFNYSSKNSALSQAYKNVEKEITANEKAYTKYMQKANSVGLSSTWKNKVQNGSYSISEVTNDTLKDQIEEYQEWYDKAQDCKSAVQNLKDQLKEIAKMKFDNVIDMYDTIGSVRSSRTSVTQSKIALREAKGDTSSKTYQKLLKTERKQMNSELSNLQDELTKATKVYNNNKDIMTPADAKEAEKTINELKTSIYEMEADIVDLDNSIQEAVNALSEVKIDYYQSVVDKDEAQLAYRASIGKSVTSDTYKGILEDEQTYYNKMIKETKTERKNLQAELDSNWSGGEEGVGHELTKEERYELKTEINELTTDIYNFKADVAELDQQIAQIEFDKLNKELQKTTNYLTKLQSRMSLHESMGYSVTSEHYQSELNQEQTDLKAQAQTYQDLADAALKMRDNYDATSDLYQQYNDEYLEYYEAYNDTMSQWWDIEFEKITIPITRCTYAIDRLSSKLDYVSATVSLMEHEGVTTYNFSDIATMTKKQMELNTAEYKKYQQQAKDATTAMAKWLDETHAGSWEGEWNKEWGELDTTYNLLKQDNGDNIGVNSEQFMEIWNDYYDAITEQQKLLEENLDLADDLRELYFDTYFTQVIDSIQTCADKLDTLASLFSSFSTNTSTGQITTQGMAQLSIDLSNIDRMREEAGVIADEIDAAIAMYNDPDNWENGETVNFSATELEEQLDDLSQQYLDVASSVEAYRDSIISLCEDAMQAQLDYTEKVIDGISDTLQAEKDLYDYNKSLTEKSKNVTDIQAQIDAYTNVDTAEAKAKLAQLYADLDEAQEEYDEAIKEHTYDLQIEGLDDLKTDLEDAYDEMIEMLSTSLDEQENLISSIDTLVAGTGKAITQWLNDFASVLGVDWYYAGISTDNNTVTSVAGVSTGGVIDEPKNIQGFSTGGVVSDITKIVARNGDDSIVSVKRGETVLTDAFTKLLPKSVDVMNTFNEIKSGNNTPCEAISDGMKDIAHAMQGVHKEMSVDLHFDNLLNVEGSVDATVVDDLKQFSKDLYQNFTSQLTNEFVKLGYRR